MSDELDRRRFLCTGCAAATLVACGGPGGTVPPATDTDSGLEPTTRPTLSLTPGEYAVCTAPPPAGTDEPGWIGYDMSFFTELETIGGWTGRNHPDEEDNRFLIFARLDQDCYTVMERRCSHQGTLINYDADRGQFMCPLHASLFDWDGNPVAGPAPTALERFATVREGDTLWVYYPTLA